MMYFNIIFSQIVDNSNVKIKTLAEQTGVDRASIYQYKNGKVLPGKEFLDKFVSIMQLSNSEELSLREAHKIAQIGVSTYIKRNQLRRCLEILADSMTDDGQTGYIPSTALIRLPEAASGFTGRDKVASILKNVVDYEFALSNESAGTHDVSIQTFIPSNCHDFFQHLSELYHSHKHKTIRFTPIICFTKNGNPENNSIITALSSTMYFLFTDCPGYDPRFYYDENNFLDSIGILYPYYVITSTHLVTIDVNLSSALLISDENVITVFRERFNAAYANLKSLTSRKDKLIDITDVFLKKTESPSIEWVTGCMESGGCMERFADEDMIGRYLNMQRDDLPKILYYMQQIKLHEKSSHHLEYQNSDAIMKFAETGEMLQIQSVLTGALSPVDRKILLKKALDNLSELGNIIDSSKVKIPPITLFAIKNDCLYIYKDIMSDILIISEPEIANAFYDFFHSMIEERDERVNVLMSQAEIKQLLENAIKICDREIKLSKE